MGDYSRAAEFYDVLYDSTKDYAAEGEIVAQLIRGAAPNAHRVLDVACGTGKHAQALTVLGYAVDGVDLEPAFVATASARPTFPRRTRPPAARSRPRCSTSGGRRSTPSACTTRSSR